MGAQMKMDEQRRKLQGWQTRLLWPLSRPMLATVSPLGVALLGALSVCFAQSGMSGPGTVPQQTTTTPTPQTAKPPLSVAQERALKPGNTFSECQNCPVMVVVPAGVFTMGSPTSEAERSQDESPANTQSPSPGSSLSGSTR